MILALKKAVLKWSLVALAFVVVAGCSNNSSSTIDHQKQKNSTSEPQNTTSKTSTPPSSNNDSSKVSSSVVYQNTQYGFSFKLPKSWSGYTIVKSQWEGISNEGLNGKINTETGPMLSIRDPNWTVKNPRQDIPIMILTLSQWDSMMQGKFHIGAAPVEPKELGRNNYYVFALPARYNFAFLPGYKEVETILASNPLQTSQTANPPDSTANLLFKMMAMAKQGNVINCDFAAKTTTIADVEKVWGKADKTDWVAAAKGFYSTYSKHDAVVGYNKDNQIFELRSTEAQLKSITLSKAKEALGTPVYDVKINGQEIIGYVANSSFKLELVFPQPTNSKPNPVIDHYNVLYPEGTSNSKTNDPGRKW